MQADDWVKVITAVAGALVVILGAIGALWAKVHAVGATVNGRMTELLELTRKASKAEGVAEGSRSPGPPPTLTEDGPLGNT